MIDPSDHNIISESRQCSSLGGGGVGGNGRRLEYIFWTTTLMHYAPKYIIYATLGHFK